LTRRKVVQWGIAYAAGAWGLLQGVQFLAEAFEWPTRVLKLSTFALLVGLPIVLVLAWYHGDRGEQRIRRTELAIVTLLFLLGGGVFWLYQGTTEESPATTTETPAPVAAAPADARPSIAVLPFENRSDEHKDIFFVDGIHDDIITQLSKVSAMKVISRTSVERFRDTKLPLKNIAEQLGVTKILEGGVQRAGDRVRITVQLIDAATDTHLWAESYDRELTAGNIFAIQSEVATVIAAAMKAVLSSAEKVRVNAVPTKSLEAWEAYQLGKRHMAKRTTTELANAERFFRQAIGLDPAFAPAYAGLADSLTLQTMYGTAPLSTTLASAEQAVETALKLDAQLADAWAASAIIAEQRGQYEKAESMFRRALALNANDAFAHQGYSDLLRQLGRVSDGLQQARLAVALDPFSAIVKFNLAGSLWDIGNYADAEGAFREAIQIDPQMAGAYSNIGLLKSYALRDFVDGVPFARRGLELDSGSPDKYCWLAMLLIDIEDLAGADQMIDLGSAAAGENNCLLDLSATTHLYRGNQSKAVGYAERALKSDPRDGTALAVLLVTELRRNDPRTARARYATAYPELSNAASLHVDGQNHSVALDLAFLLKSSGEGELAQLMLRDALKVNENFARLSMLCPLCDVYGHAFRGDRAKALAALREAAQAGWRGPLWRYYRDFDPNLASVRDEPEFKAVFADIERDMARQRGELAARPKDAPLDLAAVH
jgi:TolB-like protein/Tfp pilus assembly protein PilF